MTSTDLKKIVGQNIKLLREEMGLTQDALATYLGISREQIAYYEAGSRSISTEQLSKLANLFCLNEYDFYEEDSSKRTVNLAFAFRADSLQSQDLESIAHFKKIVRNYMNMKTVLVNE